MPNIGAESLIGGCAILLLVELGGSCSWVKPQTYFPAHLTC